MAINFRLSYNNGFSYTDLFPNTDIDNIIPTQLTTRDYAIDVTIPPSVETKQMIALDVPSVYVGSQAFVELLYEKPSDFYDYNTITQVIVVEGGIEVTRLFRKPKDTIHVTLVLNTTERNFLQDTNLEVVVPPYSGLVQEIAAPVTRSQAISQFYVDLVTTGDLAEKAFYKITQIEAREGKILIYRFGESSDTEIKIKIRFREGSA